MTFNLNGKISQPCKVAAGNANLEQVQCTKLLGFHIDSALVWETHIDELCGKLGRTCFALGRLASTATRTVVRSCYFATVHSALTYGVEIWGRAADRQRAFVMQKRAVRSIVGVANDVSCRDLFKQLKILPLPCELIYQIALYTHTHPNMFRRKGIHPSRSMRSNKQKDRLVTPIHTLTKSERSVFVMGPSVYNRLPDTVRDAPSTISFKVRLKKWLLEHCFYDVQELYNLPEFVN